jgi:hypothetical protein
MKYLYFNINGNFINSFISFTEYLLLYVLLRDWILDIENNTLI